MAEHRILRISAGKKIGEQIKDILLVEGVEESFPASDPPSYMAGSAISGSPPKRKSDEPKSDKDKD